MLQPRAGRSGPAAPPPRPLPGCRAGPGAPELVPSRGGGQTPAVRGRRVARLGCGRESSRYRAWLRGAQPPETTGPRGNAALVPESGFAETNSPPPPPPCHAYVPSSSAPEPPKSCQQALELEQGRPRVEKRGVGGAGSDLRSWLCVKVCKWGPNCCCSALDRVRLSPG